MTTPAHTMAVAEVLAAHQHERNFWECTGGDHHTYQGELPARRLSHAQHQAAMLAAAGVLADPAQVIRDATNALMDDAASSDYLADEVSDDGLAWIARLLRTRADRIERQEGER